MTPNRARSARQDIFDLTGRGEDIREASEALKAMAHPLRLKILCLVGHDELLVQEIVEAVGTSQSNISQHLAVMRKRGPPRLAQGRQQGLLPDRGRAHPEDDRHDARGVLQPLGAPVAGARPARGGLVVAGARLDPSLAG